MQRPRDLRQRISDGNVLSVVQTGWDVGWSWGRGWSWGGEGATERDVVGDQRGAGHGRGAGCAEGLNAILHAKEGYQAVKTEFWLDVENEVGRETREEAVPLVRVRDGEGWIKTVATAGSISRIPQDRWVKTGGI